MHDQDLGRGPRLDRLASRRHRVIARAAAAMIALLAADARLAHAQTITPFANNAAGWKSAAPCWEGYAIDQFLPGIPNGTGCLANANGSPVILEVGGGLVSISVTDGGAPVCAIRDAATTPATAEIHLASSNSVATLEFDPPIVGFYAYFGSVAIGHSNVLTLFAGDGQIATLTTQSSAHGSQAFGFGFVTDVPVDRIEISSGDSGASVIGTFVGLAAGQTSLGTRQINGYAGPTGATVQLDFAVAFDMPGDRVHNLTRKTSHPCVRDAIAWAASGDTLVVTPGNYHEAIDLAGKALTITSVAPDDPEIVAATRIDGGPAQTSVVRIANGEGATTALIGLTISGGFATQGGGAFVGAGASPVFDRCVFVGNRAAFGGGAFAAAGSSPAFLDCRFFTNAATSSGGGLFIAGVGIDIERCSFGANGAGFGGGITASSAGCAIRDCAFDDNTAKTRGGGVHLSDSIATIERCDFTNNGSVAQGGAISSVIGGFAAVTECTFTANVTGGDGGAVWSERGGMRIADCLFVRNQSSRGAALFLSGPTLPPYRVEHTIFRRNASRSDNGGVFFLKSVDSDPTACTLTNCLLAGNPDVAIRAEGGSATLTLRHLTVADNARGAIHAREASLVLASDSIFRNEATEEITTALEGQVLWNHCLVRGLGGSGGQGDNLDTDPRFVDAAGPDGLHGTEDDDYRLAPDSPLVDVGSHALPDSEHDLAGVPRRIGRLDIGAYESTPDCDGSGVPDYLEIEAGVLPDCNGNLVADACESIVDCNGNGIMDECDIASGLLTDANGNGYPDECEVFGTVAGTVVWDVATRPQYIMSGSVLVTGTLVIGEGVEVLALENTQLSVASGGRLEVLGSAEAPTWLISAAPPSGTLRWNGVRFLNGSSGALEHAVIRTTRTHGVRIGAATVEIGDCIVADVRGIDAPAASIGGVGQAGGPAYGVLLESTANATLVRSRIESVEGGRGGAGGIGQGGVDGQHGSAGVLAGAAGQSGTAAQTHGGPGNAGGAGGDAYGIRSSASASLSLRDAWVRDIRGGSGGAGGAGGRGGDGGSGGAGMVGSNAPNFVYSLVWPLFGDPEPPPQPGINLNGGNGGHGADGTNGGPGGPGGAGGVGVGLELLGASLLACDQNLVSELVGGAGGAGGAGGRGGMGGYGGSGGLPAAMVILKKIVKGTPGVGGNGGNGGTSGAGGSGGAAGTTMALATASSAPAALDIVQMTLARLIAATPGDGGAAGLAGPNGPGGLGGFAMLPQVVDELCPDGITICQSITNIQVVAGMGTDGIAGLEGGAGAAGALALVVGAEARNELDLFVTNAILDALPGGTSIGVRALDGASLFLSSSVVHGFATPYGDGATNLGPGSWTFAPMFVDPAGGDFTLASGSPAIDAGSDRALPQDLVTDLAGGERIVDGDGDGTAHVDLGVYEFAGAITACPADLDGDGAVGASDLAILLGAWGSAGSADLDGSGMVDPADLALLLGAWGACP